MRAQHFTSMRKGTALVRPAAAHHKAYCVFTRKQFMTDWTEELAAAQVLAERFEAAESQAEQQFHILREQAEQEGDRQRALESPEFRKWMDARHATDLAWGSWFLLKDARR